MNRACGVEETDEVGRRDHSLWTALISEQSEIPEKWRRQALSEVRVSSIEVSVLQG
jgi:hypothetical protein